MAASVPLIVPEVAFLIVTSGAIALSARAEQTTR
jgi:hypothetical protein